jgi:serine/threonine-protein kinase
MCQIDEASMNPPTQLQEGQIIAGHYLLLSHLADGGEGQLWKAKNIQTARVVVLKLLHPELREDPEARARLLREGRAYGLLNDPDGVVPTQDVEPNEGGVDGPFFVMNFLDGKTLREHFRAGGCAPLPEHELTALWRRVCEVVGELHDRGAVHRDISPRNLFLLKTGGVRLLDLGLALIPRPSGQGYEPHERGKVGTPGYCAPELSDSFSGDARSDIYSMGAVFYELATGATLEVPGHDKRGRVKATLRPRVVEPSVSPLVEKVLLKCLMFRPADRYRSVGELAQALSPKPTRVRPLPLLAAIAAPLCLGGGYYLGERGVPDAVAVEASDTPAPSPARSNPPVVIAPTPAEVPSAASAPAAAPSPQVAAVEPEPPKDAQGAARAKGRPRQATPTDKAPIPAKGAAEEPGPMLPIEDVFKPIPMRGPTRIEIRSEVK